MAKELLVVESSKKARTIKGMLGPDFLVQATGGHILEMPPDDLHVDLQNFQTRISDGADCISVEITKVNQDFPTVAEGEQVGQRLDLDTGIGEADARVGRVVKPHVICKRCDQCLLAGSI